MQQLAEQRMVAYAETSPQVRVRYHTVADGHPDDFALSVLGDILSGRTGRLYKSLVIQQEVANNASANQSGNKYEGYFELRGTAKPGKTPEDVEQALYKEIERLQKEPVPAEELQKIKNQSAADQFRGLQSNFGLMVQLLLRDANRGWATINTDPARTQAVTAEDIRRVANKYFKPENRTVGIYRTKTGGASEDPALAGLSDQEKAQIQQLRAALPQMKAEQVRGFLQMIEQRAASAPADKQKGLQFVKKMLEDRLKQLEGGTK
jgi:predicted Zn-dependent peptidase